MRHLRLLSLSLALSLASFSFAQKNSAYQRYIDQYKDAAVDQMQRYHIPASITLAQALLESSAGQSYLATRANNHFGIKVGSNWDGPYVSRDDDHKAERFRKYKNAAESYEDHSRFLQQNRYRRLFDLDPQDYKGWARGLKACGYATAPTYANRLITIIETYDLADLDEDRLGLRRKKRYVDSDYPVSTRHSVKTVNGRQCVAAREGDTWAALAKELHLSKRKLLKINEATEDVELIQGMNVFIEKKAKRAEARYKGQWHKVKAGESMYTICQFYGIKLASLYKMNFKDVSYIPQEGDLLKVR